MRGSWRADIAIQPTLTVMPLAYAGLRLRWCGVALRAFLARWGIYGLVAAILIGAGGSSPVASALGVAAWTLLPLVRAASQPLALAGVVLLQSLLGGLLVWAMRPLLWSERWQPVERALPITARALRRSDASVVALGLLPLLALYALGAVAWVGHQPAWLMPWAWQAGAAWLLMVAGSWAAGLAVMQAWRRGGGQSVRARPLIGPLQAAIPDSRPHGADAPARQPGRLLSVLVLRRSQTGWWALPLWRGPARRTGLTAALGSLGLAGWALAGAAWGPGSGLAAWQGWWLAGFAAWALMLTTRVNQLSRAEYLPLIQACTALPLSPNGLRARRAAWALLPLALALGLLAVLLPWPSLRWPVALAYLAANVLASVWEVTQPATDPAARASRWGVWLVLLVALASEVMP